MIITPPDHTAFLRLDVSHADYVGIHVEGPNNTPVYAYVRMSEEGMLAIHKQITHWLLACAQKRQAANVTPNA